MGFEKGHIKLGGGRRAGSPYQGRDAKLAARQYTELAVMTLVELCSDKSAIERRLAAIALLDRGWGKPAQTVEAKVESDITTRYKVTFELSDIARPGSYIEHASEPQESQPLPSDKLDS